MKSINLDLCIRMAYRCTRNPVRAPLGLIGFLASAVGMLFGINLLKMGYPTVAFLTMLGGLLSVMFFSLVWFSDEPDKFVSYLRERRHFHRYGYLPYDPVI